MKKQDNSKLQQIIETGRELFFKFGIRRVTVEEICEKANVSKMTFYKHFDNKTDLVKFILEQIFNESIRRYKAIIEQDIPYYRKVELIIQLKLDLADTISPEFYEDYLLRPESEIFSFLMQKKSETLGMFLHDLVVAQKKGEIRQDLKPEFVMFLLDHIVEMASDERLVKMFRTPKELIVELHKHFYYGILPRNDE
jgi:AcrR family transcriptional regulator